MLKVRLLSVIWFVICLSGCAGNISSTAPPVPVIRAGHQVELNNSVLVKQQLFSQYDEWKGTRYQIGGLSHRGVDCSGFVYITYRSKLGIDIPRTTELQLKTGSRISRSGLRAGDLVFFKTGFFTRHIGIYLGNGQFMHASSSQGVTISRLDNRYWQAKYWLARRPEN